MDRGFVDRMREKQRHIRDIEQRKMAKKKEIACESDGERK